MLINKLLVITGRYLYCNILLIIVVQYIIFSAGLIQFLTVINFAFCYPDQSSIYLVCLMIIQQKVCFYIICVGTNTILVYTIIVNSDRKGE